MTRADLDLADPDALERWPWGDHDVVLNAGAYTAVDLAETPEGRRTAWTVNAEAPATLARLAARRGFTLVHFSTDYVYDGSRAEHDEDEPLAPLGVYGQSKAAGDVAVAAAPRHYLVRTSWVVGDGANFVRTMARLAAEGAFLRRGGPGRPAHVHRRDRARRGHLLDTGAATAPVPPENAMSWADVAREVFTLRGRDPGDVRDITPRSTPRAARRAAAGEQRAVDAPDRGDRLRAGRCGAGGAAPTPRARSRPRGGRCRPRRGREIRAGYRSRRGARRRRSCRSGGPRRRPRREPRPEGTMCTAPSTRQVAVPGRTTVQCSERCVGLQREPLVR